MIFLIFIINIWFTAFCTHTFAADQLSCFPLVRSPASIPLNLPISPLTFEEIKLNNDHWKISTQKLKKSPKYVENSYPLKKIIKISYINSYYKCHVREIWIAGNPESAKITLNINPYNIFRRDPLLKKIEEERIATYNHEKQALYIASPELSLNTDDDNTKKFLKFFYLERMIPYSLFATIAKDFSPSALSFLKTNELLYDWVFFPELGGLGLSADLYAERLVKHLEDLSDLKIIVNLQEKAKILLDFINYFFEYVIQHQRSVKFEQENKTTYKAEQIILLHFGAYLNKIIDNNPQIIDTEDFKKTVKNLSNIHNQLLSFNNKLRLPLIFSMFNIANPDKVKNFPEHAIIPISETPTKKSWFKRIFSRFKKNPSKYLY